MSTDTTKNKLARDSAEGREKTRSPERGAGGKEKSVQKVPPPQVSISTFFVMVTLLVFGIVGTSRMRRHAGGSRKGEAIMTKEQLSMYTGRRGSPIYLGILGSVFDVSSGRKTYGSCTPFYTSSQVIYLTYV